MAGPYEAWTSSRKTRPTATSAEASQFRRTVTLAAVSIAAAVHLRAGCADDGCWGPACPDWPFNPGALRPAPWSAWAASSEDPSVMAGAGAPDAAGPLPG